MWNGKDKLFQIHRFSLAFYLWFCITQLNIQAVDLNLELNLFLDKLPRPNLRTGE